MAELATAPVANVKPDDQTTGPPTPGPCCPPADTERAHMRAADDGHVLPTLALPADLLSRSLRVAHSERTSLEQLPRNAFEVRGLLSDAECDALVKVVEARGFGDISWEYDPTYRSCTRLVVSVPDLAAELWRRLRPLLHLEDIQNARPFGYGVGPSDVWRPYGINECIRFTKYKPGDHFAVHRDGPFVLTDEERSVYTVMVYLNADSDYTGGDTAFVDRDETHAAPAPPVVIRGAKGKALVFEHDLWHEGRPVETGTKYILRTDLMFVRLVATPLGPSLRYADEARYQEAEALYQKSIALQKAGDPVGSTTAYLAALDAHASLSRVAPRYGPEYRLLPVAVMLQAFAYLPLSDIVHRLSRVSRGWCALARHPDLWKSLYRTHFGTVTPTAPKAPNPHLANKTTLKDWHTLFRTRYVAKRQFRVVFVDLGATFMRYGMLGDPKIRIELATVHKSSGHYWTAGSGLQHHIVGAHNLDYLQAGSSNGTAFKEGQCNVTAVQILLRWVFLEGFPTRLAPQEHPLLIARNADMGKFTCTKIADAMRTLLGVPCVAFVDSAVCALASADLSTALVLSINTHTLQVSAVYEEQTLASARHVLTKPLTLWQYGEGGVERVQPEESVLSAWEAEVVDALAALTVSVLASLAASAPAVKSAVTAKAVVRGHMDQRDVMKRIEAKVSEATKGEVSCLEPLPQWIAGLELRRRNRAPRNQLPIATMDAVNGLKRLCNSLGRVQAFFGDLETPAVKFTRPLLLWVAKDRNEYLKRYVWRGLVGRDDSGEANSLVDRVQIKCFKDNGQLQEWWDIFAKQLRVATRSDLVRVLWSGSPDEGDDSRRQIKWQATVDHALPLMLWVDSDRAFPPQAERAMLRSEGIYWVHSFRDCPPPTPYDFVSVKAGGRAWAKPVVRDAPKAVLP